MTTQDLIQRLKEKYPDAEIQVHDLTDMGSNFQVHIKTKSFEGLSRVKKHQEVMKCFSKELETGEIHALTIRTEE